MSANDTLEASMPDPYVFFYGSYMNPQVLAEVAIELRGPLIATLDDYELVIRPRANLIARRSSQAWGIVSPVGHEELERLYEEHAQGRLGQVYKPYPVVVRSSDGRRLLALCYLSASMSPGPAEREYVERIAAPALHWNFPSAYIDHIRSFAR